MTGPYTEAFQALCDLQAAEPEGRFTTARIAQAGGAEPGAAGHWTAPWRDALYACMLAGLVATPEGRPHRWHLTPTGWQRCQAISAVGALGVALNPERGK